jgi:very-short-patch-repair endonuclease
VSPWQAWVIALSSADRTVTLECKQCGIRYEERALNTLNPWLLKRKEQDGVAHLCPRCSDRVFIRRDAHRWPLCPFETVPEEIFWELARQTFPQVKIINEFEMLGYRLDFYFPDHEICVEVDGYYYHQTRELEDFERDTKLSEFGIETVRFSNEDVLDDPQFVSKRLEGALRPNAADD